LIKEESTSELLRFTIRHILKQPHNKPEYLIVKQQQEEQVENNQQQQHHSQVILPSTTFSADQQDQVSSNISPRNNTVGQKITPQKLSSLLSNQTKKPC
jgi:hypothetical protein